MAEKKVGQDGRTAGSKQDIFEMLLQGVFFVSFGMLFSCKNKEV
jgi:hypothetical protein